MSFSSKYLPKADVVFTVMFLDKLLCEKTLQIILGEYIELDDVVAEAQNNFKNAALNSIYFDVKTHAKDGRIITLDLQRKYIKNRIRNRTIYYACREIGTQVVKKSKYENLKSVIVTFLLTEATLSQTTDNKMIQLHDNKTGEIYSELLTIHEVNIRHITENNSLEMRMLRDFFQIDNQDSYDKFVRTHGETEYGQLLIKGYTSAISDIPLLDDLSGEEKYMKRLSEEERLEERQEGRQEEKYEIARNMIEDKVPVQTIMKYTGLSSDEINELKSMV